MKSNRSLLSRRSVFCKESDFLHTIRNLPTDKFLLHFIQIDVTALSGKQINIIEQVPVNGSQRLVCSRRQGIQIAALKQLHSFLLADAFFLTRQFGNISDSRFILKYICEFLSVRRKNFVYRRYQF